MPVNPSSHLQWKTTYKMKGYAEDLSVYYGTDQHTEKAKQTDLVGEMEVDHQINAQ